MNIQQTLAEHLDKIQTAALTAHERTERAGQCPLRDIERGLLGAARTFPTEIRLSVLWNLMLFTMPRFERQDALQNIMGLKFDDPETSLIARQLRSSAPRVWSYRFAYDRSFAHTIAGPRKNCEIALNGCVDASGDIPSREHLYVLGWTLSFKDKIFLVAAGTLTQSQAFSIETIRPFPRHMADDDFWEETFTQILTTLYPPTAVCTPDAAPADAPTPYNPESFFLKLQRIFSTSISAQLNRGHGDIFECAATRTPPEILQRVRDEILRHPDLRLNEKSAAKMERRFLEAIGCDETGNMPHAHIASLINEPAALLCLPESEPMLKNIDARAPIKRALALESPDAPARPVADAFKVFVRERRWLAAFAAFDFSCEEHAARFGIPIDQIRRIFSPQLFATPIPNPPQGDLLRQLQTKFGLYLPDNPPPSFQDVIDAMQSRNFCRAGNHCAIAQWIISACDKWRNHATQISPEISSGQRNINAANHRLLQKGLSQLADMFRKK